ncbi:MAG: class I SAM-dependent methyltransferase [Lysobacterales bacterium]
MKALHFTPEITDELVRVHEQYLVPAVYAQWAARVVDIAEIEHGHHVLDVACGTGSLARAALFETGLSGKVVGLDISKKMLESAHRQSRQIDWQLGDATSLPFEKNRFDRVMCQFSLMFIANRVAAIKEMLRVCKPGGLVVLAIWGPLQRGGAYDVLINMIEEYSGSHAAMKISSPWKLGKPGVMDALLLSTGVDEYECHERVGQAAYPSMRAFVEAHLRLADEYDKLNENAVQEIMANAATRLHSFLAPNGQLITHLDANIFTVKAS